MVVSTMGVDEPPPEPPETAAAIVNRFLGDLRRAGLTVPSSVLSNLETGALFPTGDLPSIQQGRSALMQTQSAMAAPRGSQPATASAVATSNATAAIPAPFVFTSAQDLQTSLRTGGDHPSQVVRDSQIRVAASNSGCTSVTMADVGLHSVMATTPPFVFSSQIQPEMRRATGGDVNAANQSSLPNLQIGEQQPTHAVGEHMAFSTQIHSILGAQQQPGGSCQPSGVPSVEREAVPSNVATGSVVHGADTQQAAHVTGGNIQSPNGDGVQLLQTTLPAHASGDHVINSSHFGQNSTLGSQQQPGGVLHATGQVNTTFGQHNLSVNAPFTVPNHGLNLISKNGDVGRGNLVTGVSNIPVTGIMNPNNVPTVNIATVNTQQGAAMPFNFNSLNNSLNNASGPNTHLNLVNANAYVGSQNNLNNSAVSASVTSIANTDSASLNAINNAYIGGSVTHGLNSTTVHGMTSLNNANPVSVPIVNASNASNLRSGNNANINRNLPSINILPSADNANFDKNMPSVFNANVAKTQPSAVFGNGTAYTNARRNDTSKNPNNSRVNYQPSSQPSGMAPKSFAQLFTASNPGGHNVSISSPIPVPIISEKIIETHRGEPCITFEDNEIQQMNQIENIMLVGKFSHGKPLLSDIRSYFAKTFVLRGTVEIGLMDPRHVFLAFSNQDDCVDILVKGQMSFNGKYPMRLFRWTADFDTRFETSLAPVWVGA
nr:hypothetical protein DM860_018267 [Ipomoea batatas]